MAKDDYFVLVYKVLSYLYACLKKGKDVTPEMLDRHGPIFQGVPEKYYVYIFRNLIDGKYIKGPFIAEYEDKTEVWKVDESTITPEGISYLMDNSTIEKVKQFLKDIKDVVPGI
ncbi:YjcQ family protein [Faecalibaculum rodentium]|nr:YjcQ family protein [Faecalibaculum rodentium]